jgi:tRNA A-37 threonylcarbamoyl transferase component Bud32
MHVAASTGRVVAGRYLLQHPIGRGAMGTVWRARDSVLDRDVAIKEVRIRGGATSDETQVLYERTLREARTAARLNHPAVVTVFDAIDAEGSPWIVMELVEARSLEQLLAEDGPLLPGQAADLGSRVLDALHCAHAAGILHRDVKPSNVLLGANGRVVLTDFGIATLDGDASLTQAGMVMGTPGFTAPERVRGQPASPASDLWSLGATLYAAVEGRGPFDDRGSPLAILAAIANEEPPRPRSAGSLRPVIEALLRRDPWARPDATAAGEMLAAAATDDAAADDAAADDRRADSGLADSGLEDSGLTDDGRAGELAQPGQFAPPGEFSPAWTAAERLRDGVGDPWADEWADGDTGPLPRLTGPADPVHMHLVVPSDGEEPDWARHAWAGDEPHQHAAEPFAAGQFRAEPVAGHRRDPSPLGPRRRGVLADLSGLRPDRRGVLLACLAGLTVLGVGLIGGLAWSHGAGRYHSYSVSGRTAGAAAGFTTSVPADWQMAQRGPTTVFTSPSGRTTLQVTPTSFGAPGAIGAARLLEAQALQQDTFPRYRRIAIRPFQFSGGTGVAWQYTWQPLSGGRAEVMEALFRLATPSGSQGYRVQETAPAATWVLSRPVLNEALSTFRTHS